jgi:hypothetical protein
MMKAVITATAATVNDTAIVRRCLYLTEHAAQWSFAHKAAVAPAVARIMAVTPNHMKIFHVIITP